MAISFPTSPAPNDTYTVGSKTWVYNGYAWDLQVASVAAAFDKANAANVLACTAFDRANTKLANTDGVTFAGSLTVSNTLYAYDVVVANTMTANISGNVNNMYIVNDITHVNSIFFNTTALTAANGQVVAGQVTWNPDDKTIDVGTGESIQQVGMEQYVRILNQSGQTIYNSNAVAYVGTVGNSGKLLGARAIANNSYDSKKILGIATEDIIDGAEGFVTTFGKVRKIDTSMFSQGDVLYVSASNPGALQNTKPSAPNNKVQIGTVITKSATVGMIFAAVQRGSSLADDELATFTSITNGDVIVYHSANGRFENQVQLSLNAGSVNGLTANTIIEAANGYARVFANSVGTAGNANLSVATVAANSYAASVGVAANAYTDTVVVANTNTRLANTSGVSFNGNLYFPTGNVGIGRNDSLYKLDVVGTVNASALLVNGVAVGGGGANVGNTAPSGTQGTLWWNSEYGRLFVYYNDGDTSQWVDANPATDYRIVWNTANAAYDKANSANVLAYGTGIGANNFAGNMANSVNTYTSVTYATQTFTVAAYDKANSAATTASAAYDTANSAATTGKAIAMAIVFGG